jgi:hypothetical protein
MTMSGMEWLLELVLIGLLVVTLVHALRLERALGLLKRDRATLEEMIAGFNASTREAESGIARLREAADGAGRQITRHVQLAQELKGDLGYLVERGEKLADRLDRALRAGRAVATETGAAPTYAPRQPALAADVGAEPEAAPRGRSQAERDLMKALRMAR